MVLKPSMRIPIIAAQTPPEALSGALDQSKRQRSGNFARSARSFWGDRRFPEVSRASRLSKEPYGDGTRPRGPPIQNSDPCRERFDPAQGGDWDNRLGPIPWVILRQTTWN